MTEDWTAAALLELADDSVDLKHAFIVFGSHTYRSVSEPPIAIVLNWDLELLSNGDRPLQSQFYR